MAYDYSSGLAKMGHEITVFTPLYDEKDKEFTSQEFKIVRLKPWLKFGNAAYIPQLFGLLKNFDIINLHYPFFGGAEIVWLLKLLQKNKIKLVINYQMDVLGVGALKYFFKLHTKLIMPRIIKAADKVIISSTDYAQNSDISKLLQNNPDKFVVIPPTVDLQRFFPQTKNQELLDKYNFKADDLILLFVGALDKAHYFKGIDFLLESLNSLGLNNLKLLIVGKGDLKKTYEAKAASLGLQEKVIFCDSPADSDMPKYYNLCEALILPSIDKSEAFGIVLIEAMACAKPVIAANLPGVCSVFEDGVSGFAFKVKNREDLQDKLRKIFSHAEVRTKMGLAAQQRAAELYNQSKQLKNLEQLFLSL